MSFDSYIAKTNKEAGQNIIAAGNEILEIERIPTGSLSLDVETGGGIPIGRITSIVGKWSSGKTSVTLKIAAEFQKKWPDKLIVWIDAEGVWDPKWARVLGLDPLKVKVVRPQYAEQAYSIALAAIDGGAGLIVIDSVAALAAKSEMEGGMDDVQIAAMARVNSKFMRKMGGTVWGKDVLPPTLIYLNQFRQNVGGYGAPLIEPGGEALSFYPSLKIVLNTGELFDGHKIYKSITQDHEGVEVKAQKIKFFTEKNKTAPWKRRGHFWFFFDEAKNLGVPKGTYDRMDEIIRYTDKYGIVNQRSSAYDLVNPETGEVVETFKGKARLATYIKENPDVQAWVEKAVLEGVLRDMAGDEDETEEAEGAVSEEQVAQFAPVDLDYEEGEESSEGNRSNGTA